jgi:riboflavin synthase
MFTGIIEELGVVQKLEALKDSARLTLEARQVLTESKLGDSIAVNGVCLTVTDLRQNLFSVDIMFETLRKTNLQELKTKDKVNLERALQLQTRLGGHLVSGHVDGTGQIASIQRIGIASVYAIRTDEKITRYLLPKGSVAIDGISLTVVDVGEHHFTFSLIPHTFTHTTLGFKGIGSTVNLETDLIGKYVARFLQPAIKSPEKTDLTFDFLTEHGFS